MLLGIDLGTTNIKACVCLPQGRIVGRGVSPVALCPVGAHGFEQDFEEIWTATLRAVRQAVKGLPASQVAAIGISSQGGALQLAGPHFEPRGRVISWLDDRGHHDDDRLSRRLGKPWFAQRVGHGRSGFALGQILRLRRENPAQVRPPNRVGFVGDLIVERLCGTAAHDGTSAGLTLLYNPARRDYDPELLRYLKISPAQLPKLLDVREPAGGLSPAIARKLGLKSGIPVSAAIHDQYTAALGSGVTRPGDVMFGAGTAWVLLALFDHLAAPVTEDALVCHHVVKGVFGQILSLRTGGSAISWAARLLGLDGLSGPVLDDLLATAPAGSKGVSFWPFVTSYGAQGLAPGATGRFAGLQLHHNPAELLRAVIEGLSYELNRHLGFLRDAGLRPKRIVMCGGAAGSKVTPPMIADITGLPVATCPVSESSVLGAAIVARGLLEPERALEQIVLEFAPEPLAVRPGKNASHYRRGYRAYLASLPVQPPAPTANQGDKMPPGRSGQPAPIRSAR